MMARPRKGDIVVCVFPRLHGKPRPGVVVQANKHLGKDRPATVMVCPLTSEVDSAAPYRIHLDAGGDSGLNVESLVMVDRLSAISADKIGGQIGRVTGRQARQIEAALCDLMDLSCL